MGARAPRARRRAAIPRRLIAVGAITAAAMAALVPAAAAAPTCTGSAAAGATYTCVPNGSGSVQVTVPARVTSVFVTADGGGGGKNASLGNGGSGARVTGTIAVTAGAVLTIHVGAGGGAGLGGSGNVGGTGYGAGGNGGEFYGEGFGGGYGGGGGGSSAVLVGSTVQVVAGGGGGGGSFYGGSAGAAAGLPGGDGSGGAGTCAVGGGGGNAAGSGSAGTTSGTGNPGSSTSGHAGRGGNGIYGAGGASSGGGGGGGGYGGGGAGNWRGPYGCSQAGGGGAGGSFGLPGDAAFGSAGNAGTAATSGRGGDGQVVIQFQAPAATVPGPPTDLVLSDVETTAMTAYWTPPADDGGSAIVGYDVAVSTGGTPVTTTRVTDPTTRITGLAGGTTYDVSVTAVNAVGSSATAATGSQATSAPGTATGPATGLVFSGVTSSQIAASWTAPTPVSGWPTLGYQVRIDGGPLTWVPAPTTSYTASGLSPGTSYAFSITVVNGAGSSTPLTGSRSTLATVPAAPTALVFGPVTSTTVTATWTAPTYTGGSSVTGYRVSVDGGGAVAVAGTAYTATGLTPSAWHTFSVVAVNAVGNSTSDLWGVTSTSAPPGSPRMAATSVTLGAASTITLSGFNAHSTQTIEVTAPDASTSTFTVTVDASGSGTATYTPTQAGAYSLISAPAPTSAAFTATAAPTPDPSPVPAGSGAAPIPRTAPTIVITGRAGRGRQAGLILVRGATTGLAGERVTAHVRLAGRSAFVVRGSRRVDADGRFAWRLRVGRTASVYFASADGTRSNRVVIAVPRAASGATRADRP